MGSVEGGPLWWCRQDRALAVATVRAALDAGIAWVDTAPFYGWGRAEEIVGEAIRGRRDEVTVLTKCGTIRHADGSWDEDGSPAAIRADLEASLLRLGTDRVDVLQLHDPDPTVPVEETVGAIADLVASGKVGHVGLSNHPVELLQRAHAVAPIAVVAAPVVDPPPPPGDRGRPGVGAWRSARRSWPGRRWRRGSSWTGSIRRPPLRATCGDVCRGRRATAPSAWPPCGPRRTPAGRSLRDHVLAWARATAYPIVGARTPDEARALAT